MEMTIWVSLFKRCQDSKGRLCAVEYESIKWRSLGYFLGKQDASSWGSQSVIVKEIIPVLHMYTFHHTRESLA